MRYLRLFSVLLLSTLVITGCHHRQVQAAPPPQAQAPIVSTLPPMPPLAFPDVQLEKPKPAAPVVVAAAPPPPQKPQPKHPHRRRVTHKTEPEIAAVEPTPTPAPDANTQLAPPASGTAVLGQLSADDATANPHDNVQTERLIQHTEDRLKKISRSQQARHKEALTQVNSFLAQAKQAWAMNDVVGATTLANKAKILLDELLK